MLYLVGTVNIYYGSSLKIQRYDILQYQQQMGNWNNFGAPLNGDVTYHKSWCNYKIVEIYVHCVGLNTYS